MTPGRDDGGRSGRGRDGGPRRDGGGHGPSGGRGRSGGRPGGGAPGGRGGGRDSGGREGGGWDGGGRRDGGGRDGSGRDSGGRRDGGGRGQGGPRQPAQPRPDREQPRHFSRQAPSQRAKAADPARAAAFAALRAVDEDDAYANLVLPRLIRQYRLDTRDAALTTELVYGTLRWRGRYDAILAECTERPLGDIDAAVLDALRLGAHQLLATRIPPHAAVSATVGLARSEIGAGPAGFVNAVLRQVGERDLAGWLAELQSGRTGVEALAVAQSHPAWIVRALREALVSHGRPVGETPDLLAADNAAPAVTLLARPGLSEVAELVEAGAEPGRWSPYAATLQSGDPGRLAAVGQHRARVQDEGSQLVALALAAVPLQPGGAAAERWLDLCAGPGGKTALLSAVAAQRGASVLAVEPAPHRADLVRSSLRPEEPVEIRTADGRAIGAELPGAFDRVLVDAPCTGLGALRRRPEARWRRQPSDLTSLAPLQEALLESAIQACRPDGVVGYVTCSPHPAETIRVVEDAQRRHPGLRLLDAPAALRAAAGRDIPDLGEGPTVQLWPHLHGTDAMFLALLQPGG